MGLPVRHIAPPERIPMNASRNLTVCAALAVSLLFGGCSSMSSQKVSLAEVREFADASAKLGGYAELSTRFRDTYVRQQPYLTPAADKIAKENDAKRRAAYDDFLSVQKTVVLYMQTLSLLAGDTRFDLTDKLDDLGTGLKAFADTGLEQKHVVAYTGLTRLLTRVIASGYQKSSVESMVRDGDADLQTLLDAMITLTRFYAKTNENEQKTVLGIFDIEIPYTNKPADRMLVTLAKVHYLNKATEYRLIDKRYDLAMQGMSKVSLGHRKLRDNLDKMNNAEIMLMLTKYTQDLRMIREGLRDTSI
jgi:predicted DNA-binding protein YlxM (UPF0122 family)